MVRFIILAVLAVATLYIALLFVGLNQWTNRTNALIARIHRAQQPLAHSTFDPTELQSLPSPVQRYFRYALKPGQPIITRVRVRHEGTFAMNLDGGRWVRFTSDQHVVTHRPGFIWDGRMQMTPGLPIYVHDAYVASEGVLNPAIFGLFNITNLRGGGDVAIGELMRFFAEAAWYPTALLPSQGVTWAPIDDTSAFAMLKDGDLSLTLRFAFAADGAIESVKADARGFTKGDKVEMHPWEGRWSNYQERDGMRVPLTGEVAWLMPDGRKPYWRGTITDIHYDFGAP